MGFWRANQTEPYRNEAKQNKFSVIVAWSWQKAFALIWSIHMTHTHTQRVRLIQQAPLIHALSAPQEALAVSSPSSTSSIQVQIGTETHINPWPPASIEILAPNANATPLSLCKHQHHAHTMLEL